MLRDMTVEDDSGANRTKKVFDAVEKVCVAWDLPKPIWLQANIRDFKQRAKTRFGQDSFIEHFPILRDLTSVPTRTIPHSYCSSRK